MWIGNNPEISVIIPVFNSERYLKQTINSILTQSFQNFEIICIDDGSADNSLKICQIEAERDRRIRVIHQSNKGVSSARNKGIKLSRGRYLIFLDADDYYTKYALKIMYEDIKSSSVDAVYYNHFYDYDGKIINRVPRLKTGIYKFNDISNVILDDGTLTGILFGSVCGVVYRADIIRKCNIYFREGLTVNEDGIFNIEFLKSSDKFFYKGKEKLYAYRQYKNILIYDWKKQTNKIEKVNNYIKSKLMYLPELHLQLKRRELTMIFQISLIACQCNRYLKLKNILELLWKNFDSDFYKECIDFSKINFYKKILGFLICTKQIKLFILLVKFVYPVLKFVIKR